MSRTTEQKPPRKAAHRWKWRGCSGRGTCKKCGMEIKPRNRAERTRYGIGDMFKRPGGTWQAFESPPPCPGNTAETMEAAADYMFREAVAQRVWVADLHAVSIAALPLGLPANPEEFAKAEGLPWPEDAAAGLRGDGAFRRMLEAEGPGCERLLSAAGDRKALAKGSSAQTDDLPGDAS